MTETRKRGGRSRGESVEDLDAKIREMEAEHTNRCRDGDEPPIFE